MFTNNSNVCLIECKEIVRKCISSSNLNINCDEILQYIHEEIDADKFDSWLKFNLDTFKSKTNQASYFKKSFLNELNKGTFKKEHLYFLPNTQPLINAMRDKNITILADDAAYLYVMWGYLLNIKKIDEKTCVELNNKIIAYMHDGQTFSDYKKLLKNSKTLKDYNIDWELIDKKTQAYISQWNDILLDLESSDYDKTRDSH